MSKERLERLERELEEHWASIPDYLMMCSCDSCNANYHDVTEYLEEQIESERENGRESLRRLERLYCILRQNDGHDVAIRSKDGAQVNGIQTIKRLERERELERLRKKSIDAKNEQTAAANYERSTFDDGHDDDGSGIGKRANGGPQCGHDICERLYVIEQQTDPAIVAKIVAAADVDPVLSMALLLINVLDHSDDDTDLADAMMHRIVAANPLAGLAVLERIDDIINE